MTIRTRRPRSNYASIGITVFMLATVGLTLLLVAPVVFQRAQPATPTAGKLSLSVRTYTPTLSPTATSTPRAPDFAGTIQSAQNAAIIQTAESVYHGYTATMQAATVERRITLDALADMQTRTAQSWRATDMQMTPVMLTATAQRVKTVDAVLKQATDTAVQFSHEREYNNFVITLTMWAALGSIGLALTAWGVVAIMEIRRMR
jgi:hypothetical protein